MELIRTFAPAPGSLLAVAHLPPDTPETALLARAPAWLVAAGIPAALTHPQRRREWLAGRVLAAELLMRLAPDAPPLLIQTDEFGRPHLRTAAGGRAGAVSLSHGGAWVAALVALGPTARAGLDLEPDRAKTLALAPRWLTPPELAAVGADPARAALAWSLKETLYKLYGRRQLDFRQHLHLELAAWPPPGAPLPTTGTVLGRIIRPTPPAVAETMPAPYWPHHLRYERAAPPCWLTYCVAAGPQVSDF